MKKTILLMGGLLGMLLLGCNEEETITIEERECIQVIDTLKNLRASIYPDCDLYPDSVVWLLTVIPEKDYETYYFFNENEELEELFRGIEVPKSERPLTVSLDGEIISICDEERDKLRITGLALSNECACTEISRPLDTIECKLTKDPNGEYYLFFGINSHLDYFPEGGAAKICNLADSIKMNVREYEKVDVKVSGSLYGTCFDNHDRCLVNVGSSYYDIILSQIELD